MPLRWYDEDPEILLKPEMLQPIGSYKIRGVYNWVKKTQPRTKSKRNIHGKFRKHGTGSSICCKALQYTL